MFKKIIFSLILAFISLTLIIIGAEIVLRVLKGVPESPLAQITQDQNNTRFLFKPGEVLESNSSVEGEFNYTARINSHGYRGKEFPPEKQSGKLRIMMVGDSFTFGVGSQDHETFPALIEAGLIEKGLDVEVINAGIGHASTVRHWDNLQKIHLRYQPDVVVLFFDLTDLVDDWRWERHAVWNGDGSGIKRFDLNFYWGKRNWWQTFVHSSALAKYLQNKVVRTYRKLKLLGFKQYLSSALSGERAKSVITHMSQKVSDDELMEYDGLLMMRGRERKELIDKQWKRTTKYLIKIRDLLRDNGIQFVIAMYPHGIYAGPDQWNEGRQPWGFEQGKQFTDYYPFELMEDFCSREDILFVNTLSGFLNAPHDQYFFNWDGHLTPKGNRIVAEQLLTNDRFLNLVVR
ncbi:MAG: hypothetical protein AB1650_09480 [Candidatus Omnitrophota bacterium]